MGSNILIWCESRFHKLGEKQRGVTYSLVNKIIRDIYLEIKNLLVISVDHLLINVMWMNKKIQLLSSQSNITVVTTSNCKYCKEEYPLYDIEKEALDKQWFSYPDFCPSCRFKLLYTFLNDRHLYRRKDSVTNEPLISTMSEFSEGPIIEAKRYKQLMADDFGIEYGREITEDIFKEFRGLYSTIPKASRMIYPWLENAEYASHVWRSSHVYMSFCVFVGCEHIYNSFRVLGECKYVFSSINVHNGSQNIYQSRMVNNSSDVAFSSNIKDSSYITLCRNMSNCSECFLSCNQVNKSYMIWNKQYDKETYMKQKKLIMKELAQREKFDKIVELYTSFLEKNLIEPAVNIQNCENVTGDNMYYSQRCVNAYMWIGNQECVNTILTGNHESEKMVRIINSVESGQNCTNVIWSCSFWQETTNVFFVIWSTASRNCRYWIDLANCEECLFCISLQNKKYCILNKQYEKEEYFRKKQKIIADLQEKSLWWSFIPWSMSTFPYNDTVAYDFFKVQKVVNSDWTELVIDPHASWVVTLASDKFISDATLDMGGEKIPIKWRTQTKEVNVPEWTQTIQTKDMPNIHEVSDAILAKAIICKKTWRPFRIIKQEFDYLRKKWLPLPVLHNEVRVQDLINERPTFQLHISSSDKSWEDVLSVYPQKGQYKIYETREYRDHMYG